MTLDEARSILADTVRILKPTSRFPEGVLGAALGLTLTKRGHGKLHEALHYAKLAHLIAACGSPLVLRSSPTRQDFFVDLEGSGRTLAPVESVTPADTRPLPDLRPRRPPAMYIDPRVWFAVHKPGTETYLNAENQILTNTPPPASEATEWKRVEVMPRASQLKLVEDAREAAAKLPAGIRAEVEKALEAALRHDRPVLEFGSVLQDLHQFCRGWHLKRLAAVREFVLQTTGIDPSRASSQLRTTDSQATIALRTITGPVAHPPKESSVSEVDQRRAVLKLAIDLMPEEELRKLQIPMTAEAMLKLVNHQ